ncbi:hypothetical protein COP1_031381 [Malus domestica]
MIDLALQGVDRYLARGDIFSICINWSCKSSMCIPCKQGSQAGSDNIYFKVVAMEPSDDPSLRVNHSQTALVLGGSVSSSVPPDLWIAEQQGFAPLQGDTVKILASILTPPLCPSALSSKFRVSVLLYGLADLCCTDIRVGVSSTIREFTEPIYDDGDMDSEEKHNGDIDAGKIGRHRVLLIAAADSSEGLPPTIRRCFSHEISMGP